MCGIMGYYAFGDKRPKHSILTEMFYLLEARGHDACGWAYKNEEGRIQLFKVPYRSSVVVKTSHWKFPPVAKSMIFHTRAATQGSVKVASNNHPLLGKNRKLALVHNGIINNDHTFGIKPDTVDSLAIVKALEGEDDPVLGLNKLQGSFAIAVIKEDNNELLLARHYSPIEVVMDKKDDILYFASETRMLTGPLGVKPKIHRGFEFPSDRFSEIDFPDDHLWKINEEGIEVVEKLTPRTYAVSTYYHGGYGYGGGWDSENWGRGSKGTRETEKETWNVNCPYCDKRMDVSPTNYSTECPSCKGRIYRDDIAEYFK